MSRRLASLTVLLDHLQNYLLGRKETSEMADRNKEALLEVRLWASTSFPFVSDTPGRSLTFEGNFCASVRSASVAGRCPCRRSRASCGWRRTARSRGRNVTSSSEPPGSTTSPKAKPRSVKFLDGSVRAAQSEDGERRCGLRVMRTRLTQAALWYFLLIEMRRNNTWAPFLAPASSPKSFYYIALFTGCATTDQCCWLFYCLYSNPATVCAQPSRWRPAKCLREKSTAF